MARPPRLFIYSTAICLDYRPINWRTIGLRRDPAALIINRRRTGPPRLKSTDLTRNQPVFNVSLKRRSRTTEKQRRRFFDEPRLPVSAFCSRGR
jgi:hypothetical protein